MGEENIAGALAKAQLKMGRAAKDKANPHFKSKYADLSSVMDACMGALNEAGICVIQPITMVETGHAVKTILIHASGETLECSVPLIVNKNDMQGLGSAITYARRYGLMSMAGIAPDDDDGNAAAKAPPASVTPDQFIALRDKAEEAGVAESAICKAFKAQSLEQFPAEHFNAALKKLQVTIDAKTQEKAAADIGGDEIPY